MGKEKRELHLLSEKTLFLTEHKASQVMARKDHRPMGKGTETC